MTTYIVETKHDRGGTESGLGKTGWIAPVEIEASSYSEAAIKRFLLLANYEPRQMCSALRVRQVNPATTGLTGMPGNEDLWMTYEVGFVIDGIKLPRYENLPETDSA